MNDTRCLCASAGCGKVDTGFPRKSRAKSNLGGRCSAKTDRMKHPIGSDD
jgi:hypothetical protein